MGSPSSGGACARPGLVGPLTGRDLEVLRLLAWGWPHQHIARDLVVALDTVGACDPHAGQALTLNRAEAATCARQLGLIP